MYVCFTFDVARRRSCVERIPSYSWCLFQVFVLLLLPLLLIVYWLAAERRLSLSPNLFCSKRMLSSWLFLFHCCKTHVTRLLASTLSVSTHKKISVAHMKHTRRTHSRTLRYRKNARAIKQKCKFRHLTRPWLSRSKILWNSNEYTSTDVFFYFLILLKFNSLYFVHRTRNRENDTRTHTHTHNRGKNNKNPAKNKVT